MGERGELGLLPLLLYRAPAGLRSLLERDGVPLEEVSRFDEVLAAPRRFVLFDGRAAAGLEQSQARASGRVLIDLDFLREGFEGDPFESVLDHRGALRSFPASGLSLTERAARHDTASIGARVVARLRAAVEAAGGVWMRVGRFPWPYRSAFNFRVDLDEPIAADYWAFARARRALADCTTHFVSTAAYGADRGVMRDLAHHDTQSHGHFHHVYADRPSNRENLRRAHRVLSDHGIAAVGFAGPGGRWNAGLDSELEALGYRYSSEFQVAFDDWPSYPYRAGRFSEVLQIPIHPVCEGLFFEAGAPDAGRISEYFARVLARKVAAGEPAFLYGHPERRLGRHPEIVEAIAAALACESGVWRVTLTEFAAWWKERCELRWSAWRRRDGRVEIEFHWPLGRRRIGVELETEDGTICTPVEGPVMIVDEHDESRRLRKAVRFDGGSTLAAPHSCPRSWLRQVLDWETVTPLAELPTRTIRARLKKGLRWLRQTRPGRAD